MKQLEKNLFMIALPLPQSPMREIICYLIRGQHRHLLVDTAFNLDECEQSLMRQLDEIGVKIEDTDIFITHRHIDHCGLIGRLKREQNTIYASATDKEAIDAGQTNAHHVRIAAFLAYTGIPEQYRLAPESHVATTLNSDRLVDITPLSGGAKLSVGDFNFEVIEVPGHSPGHLALWEPEKKYLFSGDHILEDISPNITAWDLTVNYLELYTESLKKVREMPVCKLFPAHRATPTDINGRIDQLIQHHHDRSEAIIQNLKAADRPMTAYDIALLLEWNVRTPLLQNQRQPRSSTCTESLPHLQLQLWFACMETLAHLQNLRFKSKVQCEEQGAVLYFSV